MATSPAHLPSFGATARRPLARGEVGCAEEIVRSGEAGYQPRARTAIPTAAITPPAAASP